MARSSLFTSLLLCCICFSTLVVADILIDDFLGDLFVGKPSNNRLGFYSGAAQFNQTIGTIRKLSVLPRKNARGVGISSVAYNDAGTVGALTFSVDALSLGNGQATWDGNSNPGVNPSMGPIDLTAGGSLDALNVAVFACDLDNTKLDFYIWSGPTAISHAVAIINARDPNADPTIPDYYAFPLSIFSQASGIVNDGLKNWTASSAADLSKVSAIQLQLNTPDITVDLVLGLIEISSFLTASKTVVYNDESTRDSKLDVDGVETVTFTVVIDNAADAAAFDVPGVVFSDVMPEGLQLVAGTVTTTQGTITSGNAAGATTVGVDVGTILNGQSTTITFKARASGTANCGTTIRTNQGLVTAATGSRLLTDFNLATSEVFDPTPVTLSFTTVLTLSATSPATVLPCSGSPIVYDLNYGSTGSGVVTDGVLAAIVPTGSVFSISGSTAGWNCTDGAAAGSRCTLGVNLANAQRSAQFAVRVPCPMTTCGPDNLVLNAVFTSNACSREVTATSTTVVQGTSNLSITKTARIAGSVATGQQIIYDLAVTNSGPRSDTGATITETVPASTTFNSASSTSGWSCTSGGAAGSTCTFNLGAVTGNNAAARTVAFAVTVDATVPCPMTNVPNTATVRGTCNTATVTSSTVNSPIAANVVLLINKRDTTPQVIPGQDIVWQLTFANTGSRNAGAATLTETVPQYTTYKASGSSAGWTCSGATCTFNIAALNAGSGNTTVTFVTTVDSTLPPNVFNITNTATLATACESRTAISTDTVQVLGYPNLYVRKADNIVTTAGPNQVITYTIEYGNTGARTASGVTITDTLPAGLTFRSSGSSAGWSCTGQVCTFNKGSVAAGETGSILIAATTTADMTCNPPPVINTVSITSTTGEQTVDLADNQATETTNLAASPALAVTMTAPSAPVAPCGTGVFTINYQNNGLAYDTGVTLSMKVPAGTTFNRASSTTGWSCADNSAADTDCTYTVGRLNSLASGSVTFAAKLSCEMDCATPTVPASVTITGACGSTTSSASAMTVTGNSMFTITNVVAESFVIPGQSAHFTLNYCNTGDMQATNSKIALTLPATCVLAPALSDNRISGMDVILGTLTQVAPGNCGTAAVVCNVPNTVTQSGIIELVATISGGCSVQPQTARAQVPLRGPADLTLTKSAKCSAVEYTLAYSNKGSFSTAGVAITENLPAGTTFDAALSSAGWSCTGSTCTYAIGDLAAGASGEATFVVKPNTVTACITNTASIADNGANGADLNGADNSASATLSIDTKCPTPCPSVAPCPSASPCPSCRPCPSATPCPSSAPCPSQSPCPSHAPCPSNAPCPSHTPCPSSTPCPSVTKCPCCPKCEEPEPCHCASGPENQVNFVFSGMLSGMHKSYDDEDHHYEHGDDHDSGYVPYKPGHHGPDCDDHDEHHDEHY